MDTIARITSKGQITLPKPVRDALGLKTGDRVLFRVKQGGALIAKTPDLLDLAGSVPVPPELKGASWTKIKKETWRRRAQDRH